MRYCTVKELVNCRENDRVVICGVVTRVSQRPKPTFVTFYLKDDSSEQPARVVAQVGHPTIDYDDIQRGNRLTVSGVVELGDKPGQLEVSALDWTITGTRSLYGKGTPRKST